MDQITFIEKSLRLRYEVFSRFATEVNRAETIEAAGVAIASNLKFILDTYIFRFTYINEQNRLTYELFRAAHTWKTNQIDMVTPFEMRCQHTEIPLKFTKSDIADNPILNDSIFANEKVILLFVLPLQFTNNQQSVIMIASKNPVGYHEVDFRFVKLIGELLTTKISQLLLMEKIGSKNKELESAYADISVRNSEIVLQQKKLLQQSLELRKANFEIKALNTGLEKTVEERTKSLKEANHELNTLFYRTSHDFLRPLRSIVGLTNLAAINTSDEQNLQIFSHINKSVNELEKMLVKLQMISFAEQEVSVRSEINFPDIIESLYTKFKVELKKKEMDFKREIHLKSPFYADPYLITVILENLIENAINFSQNRQSFIKIVISESKKSCCIKVTDNGQGIKKEFQPKIFDMYFRGNESSAGNGLGLYVIKKLVQKQKGEISFKSSLGKGSEFQIRIP